MSKKVICEILIELEIEINQSSTKDQVARQIHGYLDRLKTETFEHFTVGKVIGDYNFMAPESEDESSLEGDPADMIKV